MSLSVAEERIRRLMARLSASEHRATVVQDKILRTRQNLAGFYQVGAGRGCVTTLTGHVYGNPFVSPKVILPGVSSIQVVGHVTGNDYGTHNTESDGTFDFAIPGVDPSDTSLDFYVTGPTARFGTSPAQLRTAIVPCGANVVAEVGAVAATGYWWILGLCNYPIKSTLSWTESFLGSGTITAPGDDCFPYTTLATASCPTPRNTNITVSLSQSAFYTLSYPRASNTLPCPIVRACGVTGSQGASASQSASLATINCADATNLFSISWTYTVTDDPVLGTGTRTMTFFET